MPEKPQYFEATINVLGYQEEAEWVALALEMDLRGYGGTWEEALDDLRDVVLMQISFAHFKGEVDMIWHRAEEVYWEKFSETQRMKLRSALADGVDRGEATHHAGGLVLPPAYVVEAMRGQFEPANA